nr:ribonuclease H-like domain-containing protein [Tanacetum cinerariifolium]
MSDHEDKTINEENAPPKVVPQITTVTNIYAKFPYLKKGEYDIWAMKMQNCISSFDLLCWNIVLKGNNAKSMTTDKDGNLKIRPPVTAEEHQQNAIKVRFGGNAESKKMHKSLLKQKFEEFKISKEEGLDKGYDKMQKILTQMNTLKIKPDPEDVNMKFLRGLPPFWSGIALILKTKGGLEYISFDDLYNKLKFLEIDTKGYSSSSSTLSNAAFVSTAGSSQGNLSYQESENGGYLTSPGSSSSMGSLKSNCSVVDDVIYSFFANHEIDQHLVYEDLDQINKEDFEEYDLKHQMAMLSIKECRAQGGQNSNNYQKYKSKEAGKDGSDSKAMVVVDGSIDWDKQTEGGNTEPRSLKNFSMIAGIKIESDADSEGEVAKWNNSGKNLYKLIDSSMSVRTKRGLELDKFIGEGELGNYMPPSNIPDIDESQMVYGKKATDSSEIKTNDDSISKSNDSVLFDFSDRSLEPSTNDLQMCDSSVERSQSNHSDHDSTDSISRVSAPTSESRDTIVIDCDKQEDFPSVCTSSIETDVKSSKTLCNKSFNKESHFKKHNHVASKSCYVCGSYLHLIKDCDLHERRFAKNTERKGILGRRPTGKPVNLNRPTPVSAGQQKPVSAGPPNSVSAGQPNLVSAGQPNLVSVGQPNPVSADNSLWLEKEKNRGIVDSGCSRSMSGNKDKLEDFEDFDGGEVTFGGSTGKISGKGTIKTKTLNFENVLYVKELHHLNLISVSQICDQTHRVLFTENECLVLSKDFSLPDPSMKNRTLIEAARTMLADSLLPIIFWSEEVATACYVLNRVLVTKPHHKTPYELLTGDKPSISYLTPLGCYVTILNTSDPLGKFNKKSDEGYIVGYSISSKAYIVYNLVSRKIEETMILKFLENKPFVAGTGQAWMFGER